MYQYNKCEINLQNELLVDFIAVQSQLYKYKYKVLLFNALAYD